MINIHTYVHQRKYNDTYTKLNSDNSVREFQRIKRKKVIMYGCTVCTVSYTRFYFTNYREGMA